jgi:hypothetical protein
VNHLREAEMKKSLYEEFVSALSSRLDSPTKQALPGDEQCCEPSKQIRRV